MLKGFKEAASEANCVINRVTVVENPWCTIGGIATAVLEADEFIAPINAVPGDVLVLTKPLGTQIACAAFTPNRRQKLENVTNSLELEYLRDQAAESMGRLNRIGAELMHNFGAHACTDVTGFGILGHAKNLAMFQVISNF